MRVISVKTIADTVADLCVRANTHLRGDVIAALRKAVSREKGARARKFLSALLENADCARKTGLALCQDTGLAYVFVELGQQVAIRGGDLVAAIQKGIVEGYRKGSLRNSVVTHPLKRGAGSGFAPGVVHIDVVKGSHLRLSVLPKGFGSENKSLAKMFKPTADIKEIKDFILDAVKAAGADACPPYVIGVGIGGGFDYAAFLAKKALLRKINGKKDKLERELLEKINRLDIGPLGLGGHATALGVNIATYPTHIAGLPVAVNISCHALRSASRLL